MSNISKALKIDGWMEKSELLWLAEQATRCRQIVEVGSFLGRSTRALLDNTDGFVVAIDDWHGPREIEIEKRHTIYERFLANTADCKNLVVVKADHRDLPEPGFKPDFVFIDGGHEYEAVKADIQYWLPRIATGGLISGHDFHFFEGVRQAVAELLPGAVIAPETSIWFKQL